MSSNSNSFASTRPDVGGYPEPWIFRAAGPLPAAR
jgi:hypothetical protein